MGLYNLHDARSALRYKFMIIGTIIHLSSQGWGFIISPKIPFKRIFFHWSALTQDTLNFMELRRGMKVNFEAKDYPLKGLRAIKISVLKGDSNEHHSNSQESNSNPL